MVFEDEISKLSRLLHTNGDEILSGKSKLCLNAAILQKISCEFKQLCQRERTPTFDIVASHVVQSPLLSDLQFLHDFFQKVIGLRVVNRIKLQVDDNIDVSKFKSVKFLEIKDVPVRTLIGLKVIQSQVECIVCNRGLSSLEELLAECGADKSTGFVWSELREAVFSYNWICKVDTSVAFAPWLQVLDLSHNAIEDVKALECLPNLKYVNLAFNKLTTVPTFNKSTRKKIDVLVLKNNFIETLAGLSGLDHLVELDVSYNFVCTPDLQPFLTMSTLRHLSLEGNPISLLPNYRFLVVGFLNISASFGEFLLDGKPLNKIEKDRIGIEVFSSRPQYLGDALPSSFIFEPPVQSTERKKPGRTRARLAAIRNIGDGTYEDIPPEASEIVSSDVLLNESIIDPQETKRLLESARMTFGDNWLRCEAAGVVHNILGLPQSCPSNSIVYDDSCLKAMLDTAKPGSSQNSHPNQLITKAIIEKPPENQNESEIMESFLSYPEENNSAYFSLNSTEESVVTKEEDKEPSPDIETIQDPENPEKIYLVTKLSKSEKTKEVIKEQVFVSFSQSEIKEKDVDSGKTIACWSHGTLESGTRCKNEVHLVFDTIRKDRRERVYELEPSDAQEVLEICRRILEQRSLTDMNQTVFVCMKCSSQFSIEKDPLSRNLRNYCPICNSKTILETDDVPLPSKSLEKEKFLGKRSHNRSFSAGVVDNVVKPQNLNKSSSQSSIGSAVSFDDSSPTPTIVQQPKRYESDIEILSNPSQSSIEVIEAPRLNIAESTEKKLQLPAFSNLTESSSSGSATDSICTQYENPSMVSSGVSKKSDYSDCAVIEEELEKSPKDFEHMLKEVLDQVALKVPKNYKQEKRTKESDKIEFSYTDFSQLDHRVKLFLYTEVFENNSEHFLFFLRCQLLQFNSDQSFEACIVGSNKKLYLLKVVAPEKGDDISKIYQKLESLKFGNILVWKVLPYYQGFSFSTSNESKVDYLVLLKDPHRTRNFEKYLASGILSDWSTNETKDPDENLKITQLLLSFSEEPIVKFFTLILTAQIYRDKAELYSVGEAAIIVSNSHIILVKQVLWLAQGSESIPKPVDVQKISDLLQSSLQHNELSLQFLNESEGVQHIWKIYLMTNSVAESLLTAIKAPWEELFSVPLHVAYESLL